MAEGKIFVGRKAELEQFKEILKNPKGQAVLVVGQVGMGKTWLVNKMAEIAENHPKLKCGWVRYEVTPTDSVDSMMALMMDNAFEAAQVTEGSFNGTTRRLEQWKSLLNVINIGDLVMSLKRDMAKNTRDQYLERLKLISKRMPKNGRAIFVIDPEKYMQEKSDQSWAIVVKELPEKIKFIFAQRPEDVLVESETFGALDNVPRIPEERLDILDEESVDELINQRVAGLKYSVTEVREVLSRYEGHPYALQGSLDLLKAGTKLEELPGDPTGIAAAQWKELSKRGKEAIRLFKAYAILEVGVPNEVVESVSELDTDTTQSLLVDNYIEGLLREEGEGKRIYHAILADYILEQISDDEKNQYHSRAVEVYRGKLAKAEEEQTKPDALAAMRLAEHVLAAEGKESFVDAFVNECFEPLLNLGLLDAAISLSERALMMVEKESEEEVMVTGNLGRIYLTRGELDKAEEMFRSLLGIEEQVGQEEAMTIIYSNLGRIYQTRGELDKAEEMHKSALRIDKKLGLEEGMAIEYSLLGIIYQDRGELDEAERMYKKALEINEQLKFLEGMANDYGNLGVIYRRRNELEKAERLFQKSLKIAKRLGLEEVRAQMYTNLGVIYYDRGKLDEAEEMHQKSLEIEEKLGLKEGMANSYKNIGSFYEERGDTGKAREYWEKVVGLFKKIGIPHMVEKIQGWIEGIGKGRK